MPFEYYRNRLGFPRDIPTVIHYLSGTTNNLNLYYLPEGYSLGEIPSPDRNILDRLAGHDRLWLVLSHTLGKTKQAQGNMLFDFIKEQYYVVEENIIIIIAIYSCIYLSRRYPHPGKIYSDSYQVLPYYINPSLTLPFTKRGDEIIFPY